MWKLGLSAIGLGLLAAGVGGHSADAAERRCEFRFDHEKPAWVAELKPKVRQRLANMMGHMMVLNRANNDRTARQELNCGCYMDHIDWNEVLTAYPEWYRTEPIASGKLADEHQRMWNQLSQELTKYRRAHCM